MCKNFMDWTISSEVLFFILDNYKKKGGNKIEEKRIILNNMKTPFWIDNTGRLRNE